jgi:hypothetical protein
MPKKKKNTTTKKPTKQTELTGDPVATAETSQFLAVAGTLLRSNDASFDTLREEVLLLRQKHLDQKEKMAVERDELVKSRQHLQYHLNENVKRAKEAEQKVFLLEQEKIKTLEINLQEKEEVRKSHLLQNRLLTDELEQMQKELQILSEYREKKDVHDKKVLSLKKEMESTIMKYEKRLSAKELELQEQTEHLIVRLNLEVQRTKDEMMSKMRSELDDTTKNTMDENKR